MLLLVGFLLVPMVLGGDRDFKVNDYVLEIDENRGLKSIRSTEKSSSELNLSNLDLKFLHKSAFHNVNNIKILNLANNSLQDIPDSVFANLTDLEQLSLADNKISMLRNAFVGLENLRTLNISNLPLTHFGKGCFYGLTKSTDIIVRTNKLTILSSDAFEKFADSDEPKKSHDPEYIGHRVKVCIQDGSVRMVEYLKSGDPLPSSCSQIEINQQHYYPTLAIDRLNVRTFNKGWYRLHGENTPAIHSIYFQENNITRVTSDLLNDLPESVTAVFLGRNKIERLEKETMENIHIEYLDFSDNFISAIEDGALEKMTNLIGLGLRNNRLKDTTFAATLPTTLRDLYLDYNGIREMTDGSFAKLSKLEHLCLEYNNITSLQNGSLVGLSSVRILELAYNGLDKIGPGSFQHLKSIESLDLHGNNISRLEKGVFGSVESQMHINLMWNKFTKITKDTLPDLPNKLELLSLDYNEIESLEAGSFVKVPTKTLVLGGNKISKIEKGSFDLPQLTGLILRGNLLSDLTADTFEGLGKLSKLDLSGNKINNINKGAMKNLKTLNDLDLTGNPIKTLQNGALFGLRKSSRVSVTLRSNSLELLQGGVFDDV